MSCYAIWSHIIFPILWWAKTLYGTNIQNKIYKAVILLLSINMAKRWMKKMSGILDAIRDLFENVITIIIAGVVIVGCGIVIWWLLTHPLWAIYLLTQIDKLTVRFPWWTQTVKVRTAFDWFSPNLKTVGEFMARFRVVFTKESRIIWKVMGI